MGSGLVMVSASSPEAQGSHEGTRRLNLEAHRLRGARRGDADGLGFRAAILPEQIPRSGERRQFDF